MEHWKTSWVAFYTRNNRHLLAALVLLLIGLLTYGNSLTNDFMVDDYGLILNNPEAQHIKFLASQFISGGGVAGSNPAYYRPIPHILTLLCYLVFQANPIGYHTVNLVFFYICSLGLYGLLNVLFQNKKLAFLTSLLFLTHPINGVIVNYITATGYSVLIFSMLLSLTSFLMDLQKPQRGLYVVASFLWFLAALLSHETAVAFPLYLAAALFFVRYPLREIFWKSLPFFALVLIYLIFRWEFVSLKEGLWDKIPLFGISFGNYLATFSRLVAWYFSKLIFLKEIVLIWATPIVREHLLWWNLGLVVVVVVCVYCLGAPWKRDPKSFALSWMGIGLVPVGLGCFFYPASGLVIEPHWLFFSSIGFFFLANGLVQMEGNFSKNGARILGVLLLSIYVFNSRQYNALWADERRYCQAWMQASPGLKTAVFYLAGAHMRQREYKEARALYPRALSGGPEDWQIYANLGLMDHEEGFLKA